MSERQEISWKDLRRNPEVVNALWKGYILKEDQLGPFILDQAEKIKSAWLMEDEDLLKGWSLVRCRSLVHSFGRFARNVKRKAYEFYQSGSEAEKEAGNWILTYSALSSIYNGIERIHYQFPEVKLDEDELIGKSLTFVSEFLAETLVPEPPHNWKVFLVRTNSKAGEFALDFVAEKLHLSTEELTMRAEALDFMSKGIAISGKKPTEEQVAAYCQIPLVEIIGAYQAYPFLNHLTQIPLESLEPVVAQDSNPTPEEGLEFEELRGTITRATGSLDLDQQDLIRENFGLEGFSSCPLRKLAREWGIPYPILLSRRGMAFRKLRESYLIRLYIRSLALDVATHDEKSEAQATLNGLINAFIQKDAPRLRKLIDSSEKKIQDLWEARYRRLISED